MLFINISIKSNVVQILMKICIFPMRPDFRDIYTFSFTVVHFSHSYLFNILFVAGFARHCGQVEEFIES